jgi:hypothetical protein
MAQDHAPSVATAGLGAARAIAKDDDGHWSRARERDYSGSIDRRAALNQYFDRFARESPIARFGRSLYILNLNDDGVPRRV